MDTPGEVKRPIIFFDGVCNLCNGSINFIIDRDKHNRFMFAPLQSAIAKEYLAPEDQQLESIVLYQVDGTVLRKSDAALTIAKHLSGAWPVLSIFKILPRFIRDGVYSFIARNRYAWFGKQDVCRVPTPELRERFLETS